MRISDWSSDVCSSDLQPMAEADGLEQRARLRPRLVDAGAVEQHRQHHVLQRGELGQQVVELVDEQIGRASCRERGCQYVLIWVVAVSLTKNTKMQSHL